MSEPRPSRTIAKQIVASADSVAYLAEALGRTSLPDAWRFGPSFEVRLRFRPRLCELSDAELARRLDAMGVTGPLRLDRLAAVGERRDLQAGDLAIGQSWCPRGFGLWRLDGGAALGVKVYASKRPPVDLLLAVPPKFLKGFTAATGFAYWKRLPERLEDLEGLMRLCTVLLITFRRAQPIAQIEAAHVQDQAWCETLHAEDRGLVLPLAVAEARAMVGSVLSEVREGWASIPLE
jgi:hypothetical protein